MRARELVSAALLAAAMIMAPAAAQAQVTQYTTLDSFLAAIALPGTDRYDGLAALSDPTLETIASPLDRTAGPYVYTASAANDLFATNGPTPPSLSTNTATDPLTFTKFSSTVRGIGGNFFLTNLAGNVAPGRFVIAWTAVGSVPGSVTLQSLDGTGFFGVVSASGPFMSFTVTAIQIDAGDPPDPSVPFFFPTADNVVLGAARSNISVVPEPQTVALLAIGLTILGIVSDRRMRSRA